MDKSLEEFGKDLISNKNHWNSLVVEKLAHSLNSDELFMIEPLGNDDVKIKKQFVLLVFHFY